MGFNLGFKGLNRRLDGHHPHCIVVIVVTELPF